MTSQHDKAKRWRPWQFSLPTALIWSAAAPLAVSSVLTENLAAFWASFGLLFGWVYITLTLRGINASRHDKPKRWRPRFSVRTLVVVVTLVCSYAACWGPTTRNAPRDIVVRHQLARDDLLIASARPLAPLLVGAIRYDLETDGGAKCYYFWFFGYVAKLPYEREIDVP